MKLIIDGKEYDLDSDFFVDAWYKATLPYLDPGQPQARKYGDIRLAAKGVLRFYMKQILQVFAQIFHVENWRDLAPKKGEDALVKLHGFLTLLMRAEGQHLIVEMESEPEPEPKLEEGIEGPEQGGDHDSAGVVDGNKSHRLTLARAGFDAGQTIYQRPDTGRAVTDARGPDTAFLPATSSGGLESLPDAAEIQ